MPAPSERSTTHDYYLEVQARGNTILANVEDLLSRYYPSAGPQTLARTIAAIVRTILRAVKSVYSQLEWSDDDSYAADMLMIKSLDLHLSELASHLRYVARAQSHRMPWASLPAFESWASSFLPDHDLMLRPKWNYNYTLNPSDFRQTYRAMLRSAAVAIADSSERLEEEAFVEMQKPFYVIAFPALERENILLHSLLGHEVGHLLAEHYLDTLGTDAVPQDRVAPIRHLAETELRRHLPEAPQRLLTGLERERLNGIVTDQIQAVATYWRRGLEELLSDIVAGILLGPAALLSLFDYSRRFSDPDESPSIANNFYPSWRLRIRVTLTALARMGFDLQAVPDNLIRCGTKTTRRRRLLAIDSWLKHIREFAEAYNAGSLTAEDPLLEVAYRTIERETLTGFEWLLSQPALANAACRPETLTSALPELIERLDIGIPPNEIRNGTLENETASTPDIINAAWFHRVSYSDARITADYTRGSGAAAEKVGAADGTAVSLLVRDRRNRLTLKALEYSHVARLYRAELAHASAEALDGMVNSEAPQFDKRGGQRAGSVLGRSSIIAKLLETSLFKSLVITPLVDAPRSLGAVSVDVRLGTEFILLERQQFGGIDVAKLGATAPGRVQRRLTRALGEFVVLHPRELVIGSTFEYVHLPEGVMCYVIGKSSWGRLGLIIATATKVDPGYRGCITLEIVNLGEVPVKVFPGMPIAQLVLHSSESGHRYRGAYNCAIGPEFPKFPTTDFAWSFWTNRRLGA